MAQRVVEVLLRHLDDYSDDFRWLWRRKMATPGEAVVGYRSIVEEGVSNLEDDRLELGELIISLLDNLTSEEKFELGTGVLRKKDQYQRG